MENLAVLYRGNKRLKNTFELLGDKENSITSSFGWVLSRNPEFLRAMISRIAPKAVIPDLIEISLQEFDKEEGGFTDIEIASQDIRIIIEAKRGWILPDRTQLGLYAKRLKDSRYKFGKLVVVSECSPEYVEICDFPRVISGCSVDYMSWRDVTELSKTVSGNHEERRMLNEFKEYLQEVVRMQDQQSNMVFVVALGEGPVQLEGLEGESKISWRDVVEKKQMYFHPAIGGDWPRSPPNYIAFRYNGRLQSVHHVERVEIVPENLHAKIYEIPKGKLSKPFFLYTLGPAIKPSKDVRSGNIRDSHKWVAIDLLLTCSSIKEAANSTKKRDNIS